jgi:hypothetical protein
MKAEIVTDRCLRWAWCHFIAFGGIIYGDAMHYRFRHRLADRGRCRLAGDVTAFERWVGQSIPDYGRELAAYVKRRRPDGTVSGP